MLFAKRVFTIAGIYGLLALVPMYFLEPKFAAPFDEINHPEFYYGFIGVGAAFQLVFLVIAQDPARYRPLMQAAMVEKASFAVALIALFASHRLAAQTLPGGIVDAILCALFVAAYAKTKPLADA